MCSVSLLFVLFLYFPPVGRASFCHWNSCPWWGMALKILEYYTVIDNLLLCYFWGKTSWQKWVKIQLQDLTQAENKRCKKNAFHIFISCIEHFEKNWINLFNFEQEICRFIISNSFGIESIMISYNLKYFTPVLIIHI